MSMQFRLLGGLEVRVDQKSVDLGHPRQQCVLVSLLVDVNTRVSTEQLLERVWGDTPPKRGRNTLYSYLSRLRQALEEAGAATINRRDGGYVIDVDPLAVDLHQFTLWTSEARTAEAPRARFLLEQAVSLRRGDLLPQVDSPWLNELRTLLAERHRAAEMDLTDLRLRCGEHTDLLNALPRQVARHPLDERLVGQLMLALYRSGQQATALDHYERIRRELAEQLGADPSPPLRQLHRHILTADPVLAAPDGPRAPAAAQPTVIPRQLPSPPSRFTAREQDMEALGLHDESDSVTILAVGGAGGMGKTWLALRWAHDNLDRFPDGQLFVNLQGFEPSEAPVGAQTALRSFLEALGVAPHAVPTDLNAQIGLYRSLTSDKKILIFLDNAHDTEQVLPLLPGSLTSTVVITSRHRLSGLTVAHGAHTLTLRPLPANDSLRLFTSHLGQRRMAEEGESASELLDLCGGMPLAISILAARAAAQPEFPLATLTDDLRQVRNTLDAFDVGDTTSDIRAVLTSSYRTLSRPASRLFRLFGMHPGPDTSLTAAAALAAEPPKHIRAVLTELVRAHLVTEERPGRYTLHDLLRAYAVELVADDATRDEAFARLVDHYLHTAHACDRFLNVHQDADSLSPPLTGSVPWLPDNHRAAHSWFTTEHPVLTNLVNRTHAAHMHTYTWQLATTLSTFLGRGSHWHDAIAVFEAALSAAIAQSNRAEQARAHRELGCASMELGLVSQAHAHLEQSIQLCRTLRQPQGEGHTQLLLGYLWELQGDQERALRHDLLALSLFEAANDEICRARALNAAGWDYAQLGRYEEAADNCRRALTLHRSLGDHRGEANAWDSMGYALQCLGDHLEAADCYRRALAINREIGHRSNEAQSLEHLGDAHHMTGDLQEARAAWREAAALQEALPHRSAEVARLTTKIQGRDRSAEPA